MPSDKSSSIKGIVICILLLSFSSSAHASEWAKREGYFSRIWGKLGFGLKYVTLGWTMPWLESNEPEYKREWEGFCTGLGKGFVFEAAGLIQLVTFPIPVDIPDVGIGLHLPNKFCPMRHHPNWKPLIEDSKKDLKKVPEQPKGPKAPLLIEASPPASIPAV